MADTLLRGAAFPVLDADQIEALSACGERMRFGDGEQLFTAGKSGGGFFVILSGSVDIIDATTEQPHVVTTHGPGEFTGDVDIVTRRRAVVSAVARGDVEALHIESRDVRRIISDRPVLGDVLLRAFMARRDLLMESGFQGIRVIGSGRSREAFALREFLARNRVPHTWNDVDADESVARLIERFGVRSDELPVVMSGTSVFRNPTTRTLAECVGLRMSLGDRVLDLVVIGAGPAGLAAAVYASSEGLETLVLEGRAPGGQAGESTRIENYLGFPTGVTGEELMGRATLQAQKFGAYFSTPSTVAGLELGGEIPIVVLDDGERVRARSIIIATGADYRKLDVPERERFDSVGVFYAATRTELDACRGSDVIVVGGGNSAGQALMYLSQHTRRVHLLLRGDDLRRSMSSYLADRVEETENIEIHTHTEVRRLIGDDRLEAVEIEATRAGERRTIATPAVFTFIGAIPCTSWLPADIVTDPKGFVKTGRSVAEETSWPLEREPYLLETSHPGIFAAGDVRFGSVKRVSSAVGEGSMAVKFVHEYLAETAVSAASLP